MSILLSLVTYGIFFVLAYLFVDKFWPQYDKKIIVSLIIGVLIPFLAGIVVPIIVFVAIGYFVYMSMTDKKRGETQDE